MASLKYAAIRGMFELLWASQLPALIRRLSTSKGVIFTLHRVLPEDPADFSPNAILQVRPDFLEFTIERLRELRIDIVDLDEAIRRIETPERTKPFVVFTFDDAYRDNLRYALPILRRDAPEDRQLRQNGSGSALHERDDTAQGRVVSRAMARGNSTWFSRCTCRWRSASNASSSR